MYLYMNGCLYVGKYNYHRPMDFFGNEANEASRRLGRARPLLSIQVHPNPLNSLSRQLGGPSVPT